MSDLDDGDFGVGSEEEFISRRTNPKRVSICLLPIAGQYRLWFTDLCTASSQHIVLGKGHFVARKWEPLDTALARAIMEVATAKPSQVKSIRGLCINVSSLEVLH